MGRQENSIKILGLIGYPLSHSFSAKYFAEKLASEGIGDYAYRNFPIPEIGLLEKILDEEKGLLGFNVTIPYKEQILPYLDEVDPEASRVGAVNTVKITGEGEGRKLKGFNTDVYGFRESLIPLLQGRHQNALVLGTGGAARAVAYVLKELGLKFQFVSRKYKPGQLVYKDLCLSIIRKYSLIINTTPLGTFPGIADIPDIPYDVLTQDHLLYDLVYNPEETSFLSLGKQKGAGTKNGLEMLHLQAERSWEIWTGTSL